MNLQNDVFVLDQARRPMTPCRPAQARRLLRAKKAAVFRTYPLTIILKEEMPEAVVTPLMVKLDPGSKTTGIALVQESGRVVFAAELTHRGNMIKKALMTRHQYRRNRRARNTRCRPARFDNRTRPEGWLPPSLQHRVETTMTWVRRFARLAPVSDLALERVKFDMQLMMDPEIKGVEYQQGELQGYQVREYLLEKFQRTCCYCDKKDVPFEVEHVLAKSKGGSDRVDNLVIACHECNKAKDNLPIEVFLAKKPALLAEIKAQIKKPLAHAAAVNARWFAEALRLADEYAMAYDHHNFIEEGPEQAKAARVALADHLINQPTA